MEWKWWMTVLVTVIGSMTVLNTGAYQLGIALSTALTKWAGKLGGAKLEWKFIVRPLLYLIKGALKDNKGAINEARKILASVFDTSPDDAVG